MKDPNDPRSTVPPEDGDTLAAFGDWVDKHPDLEAGSVPAERIFRQRARAEATQAREDLRQAEARARS